MSLGQVSTGQASSGQVSLMQEMSQRALDLGVPMSVHFDITYRCNERCVHCYLDHDDHGEMTTAEIKRVLDELADAGTFFLTFSGGEVLMRRDFFELLEYARHLMFAVRIKTNAVMIGEAEARRMLELGVDQIQVSIYSHRPEVHDAITKLPGSLRRSIEAIRFLTEQGLRVTIANVLMTANMRDHAGVQALARELGVQYTLDPTITPKMDGDTSILNLRIPGSELSERISQRKSGGKRRRVLRPAASSGRRRDGRISVQRGSHPGLHLSLRRRLPLRPVSAAQRQRPAAEISGHLEPLLRTERSPLHSRQGPAGVLQLQSRRAPAPAVPAWPTWRAACADPRPPTARSPSTAPESASANMLRGPGAEP